jgi:integrase
VRERGPVTKYVHLAGDDRPVPTTKEGAADLMPFVKAWLKAGRPARMKPEAPAPGDTPAAEKTIRDALVDYREHHVQHMKDKSAPYQVDRLDREIGHLPLSALFSRQLARAFITTYNGKPLGRANANRYRARWMHLMNWCKREYKIAGDSPFAHGRHDKQGLAKQNEGASRQRRLKAGEEARLIKAAKQLPDGGMMVARIRASVVCGVRRGELLQLRPKDVLWHFKGERHATVLHIRWTDNKIECERFVPVADAWLLAFLKARCDAQKAFIFGQLDGAVISESQMEDDWHTVLRSSGIRPWKVHTPDQWKSYVWLDSKDPDRLTWHDLRHEAACRWLDAQMPLPRISYFLGHRNIQTTMRYLNVQAFDFVAEMKKATKVIPFDVMTEMKKTQKTSRKATGRQKTA